MGVKQGTTVFPRWYHLRSLPIIRRSVGYIVIYEQRIENQGKDTSLGSSSFQNDNAGHNTVHFDNM